MALDSGKKYAYVTLITRSSYLAGVLILAYSLKKQGSRYPLIVLYTPNLKADAIKALELEAPRTNLKLQQCEHLLPPQELTTDNYIAERFIDTWTKLRVFELPASYDAICYLDADTTMYKNMDSVFEQETLLPQDWIAACQSCVCNVNNDPWAPSDWKRENCAYTPLRHPEALTRPIQPVPTGNGSPFGVRHDLLNSGVFLFHPSEQLCTSLLEFFNTTPLLPTFKFPDQDFLRKFFERKWRALPWQYNALKTSRYNHTNIWRDDQVVCLHYVVDKPWTKRIGEDGVAGFRGNDGETHRWWWSVYSEWERERSSDSSNGSEVLKLIAKSVAKPLSADKDHSRDSSLDDDRDMRAIGAAVQGYANNKVPDEPASDDQKAIDSGIESDGIATPLVGDGDRVSASRSNGGESDGGFHTTYVRKPMLGERGHGPVIHPGGRSSIVQ